MRLLSTVNIICSDEVIHSAHEYWPNPQLVCTQLRYKSSSVGSSCGPGLNSTSPARRQKIFGAQRTLWSSLWAIQIVNTVMLSSSYTVMWLSCDVRVIVTCDCHVAFMQLSCDVHGLSWCLCDCHVTFMWHSCGCCRDVHVIVMLCLCNCHVTLPTVNIICSDKIIHSAHEYWPNPQLVCTQPRYKSSSVVVVVVPG